ncbi:MAG: radical SAM protein [Deltaproteobacteria bacterium]|nr:radical SAM protein [Deltaproteobacteria bacterium]
MPANRQLAFEQGPIRPPSEASSLLIRVTRNCPWNKCTFCSTYRNKEFSRRPPAEVKQDIQTARDMADEIQALSQKMGNLGRVTPEVVNYIYQNGQLYNDQFLSLAAWLFYGGQHVFLQDANSLVLPTDQLVDILNFLKEKFPNVNRITSYARSKTIAKSKPTSDLIRLREAGLTRLHLGLETGDDDLLKYVAKGVTAAEHVEAGQRVVASGIELSEYVVLGLGGRRWWREHALNTARALNQINPHFIRFRSLKLLKGMELTERMRAGEFEAPTEDEMIREERLLIENLAGITSRVVSDHVLNLLMEVEGQLPQDQQKILDLIDHYLNLSDNDRRHFRLGKRAGIYNTMSDMTDNSLRHQVDGLMAQVSAQGPEAVDDFISRLRERFL